MESLSKIGKLGVYGLIDCIKGAITCVKFFYNNNSTTKVARTKSQKQEPRTVIEVLMLCLGFGALYLSAIQVFEYYFLGHFIRFLTSFLAPDEEYYYWWFCAICSFQFNLCWTVSLFLLSRILTYSWFQEIADLTCAKVGMKVSNQPSLSYALSDQINSAITQSLFLAQAYVVYFLPLPIVIQDVICLFHLSILYALYAFEYKWIQKGRGMIWRLSYVEAKWPYFIGFGLPLAGITFYVGSYLQSVCVFSSIFPFYVMSSTMTYTHHMKTFNQPPFKVFKVVTMISDFLVGGLIAKVLKVMR